MVSHFEWKVLEPTFSPVCCGQHFEAKMEAGNGELALDIVAEKGNAKEKYKVNNVHRDTKDNDKLVDGEATELWGDLFGDDEPQGTIGNDGSERCEENNRRRRALEEVVVKEMWGIRGHEEKYKEDKEDKDKYKEDKDNEDKVFEDLEVFDHFQADFSAEGFAKAEKHFFSERFVELDHLLSAAHSTQEVAAVQSSVAKLKVQAKMQVSLFAALRNKAAVAIDEEEGRGEKDFLESDEKCEKEAAVYRDRLVVEMRMKEAAAKRERKLTAEHEKEAGISLSFLSFFEEIDVDALYVVSRTHKRLVDELDDSF